MKKTKTTEAERPPTRTIGTVALFGVTMAVIAVFASGGRAALGVAIGAFVAVANLALISLLVRRLLSGENRLPWGAVSLVKLVALFGGLYLLLKSGWVELLPLLIGYGALPLGIVFGQEPARAPAKEES